MYFVQNDHGRCLNYNEMFLVKAQSKKEAIALVHARYGEGFPKKDFSAFQMESLFEEGNPIHVVR